MKYVLSKADLVEATQATRGNRKFVSARKINTGQRGGSTVGTRPDGTPIYASERNRSRKKDIGNGNPDSVKAQVAAAEKRIKALKKKGKDTSKLDSMLANIKSKL